MDLNINKQYLNPTELENALPDVDVKPEDLGATDTYHEGKITQKILTFSKDDQILALKAAIQISIIGAGNKNYGFVRDKNQDVIQLKDLFDRLHIQYKNVQNAKLKDDDLTARRLVRLFRKQIQKFIMKTNKPSYLWIKYGGQYEDKKHVCFPGAEHLIESVDDCKYLLATYKRLDDVLGTTFVIRLTRVFIARGIVL